MTRKHFRAFAAIIAGEVSCLAPHERERRETLRRVMLSTADLFVQENERFDRDGFYAACGLERYCPDTRGTTTWTDDVPPLLDSDPPSQT